MCILDIGSNVYGTGYYCCVVDIAILKLETRLDTSATSRFRTIRLNSKFKNEELVGRRVLVAGFGMQAGDLGWGILGYPFKKRYLKYAISEIIQPKGDVGEMGVEAGEIAVATLKVHDNKNYMSKVCSGDSGGKTQILVCQIFRIYRHSNIS